MNHIRLVTERVLRPQYVSTELMFCNFRGWTGLATNTCLTLLLFRTQQLISVHALAREVFRIIGNSKSQVRIDHWLGHELTQTWVRSDWVRNDWISF